MEARGYISVVDGYGTTILGCENIYIRVGTQGKREIKKKQINGNRNKTRTDREADPTCQWLPWYIYRYPEGKACSRLLQQKEAIHGVRTGRPIERRSAKLTPSLTISMAGWSRLRRRRDSTGRFEQPMDPKASDEWLR